MARSVVAKAVGPATFAASPSAQPAVTAEVVTGHLHEAFLGRLADAEVEERQRDGSQHLRLQAYEQAKPLRELLEAERLDAEPDSDRHRDIDGSNHYGVAAKAPEETRKIYDYRAYHAERREGFPLFNNWGSPRRKGGGASGWLRIAQRSRKLGDWAEGASRARLDARRP
ncbi:hypothetical protein [Sagittula salina]|uniref:Uncharacterized protein n=1 Tax=Sagittula salina TaxID=2820268 RepID=A0A940MST7_9RHOB|nr:hypothetical protein [Sagittula salina]MBP0485175.1 hypothetical protein [Sagittula salina]